MLLQCNIYSWICICYVRKSTLLRLCAQLYIFEIFTVVDFVFIFKRANGFYGLYYFYGFYEEESMARLH